MLDDLRAFLLFVGNPRSGTTLVRSLANASPEALLSVEVDVLKFLHEDFKTVIGRIIENQERFARNPVWTGYDYSVPAAPKPGAAKIRVIGDKAAPETALAINSDPALLQRLTGWCPLPVRWIHCVRNPYDRIARGIIARKQAGRSQNDLVDEWRTVERVALQIAGFAGLHNFHRVYLEDLIAEPVRELRALGEFLEPTLPPPGGGVGMGWIEACRAIVFEQPNQSRLLVQWTPKLLALVEEGIEEFPHLHRYRQTAGNWKPSGYPGRAGSRPISRSVAT